MVSERMARMPRRRLAGAALVAATTATLLAGGGTSALAAGAAPAGGATGPTARAVPAGGIISTVAGGVGGPGPGTGISLSDANGPTCRLPNTVTFAAGNLYIAEGSVRKVSERTGLLTTPVGTGAAGPLGTGGPAVSAALGACGVAVDHTGNLVIADELRHRIDVVPVKTGTFYGRAMTAGHLYPVAGNGSSGPGGSGVPATKTGLNTPVDVTVDAAGNIVIADEGFRNPGPSIGSRVRVVAESTGTFYGQAMSAGDIYTVAGSVSGVGGSGDGGPAVNAELGNFLLGIRVDAAGNLVLATADNLRVRVVAASTGTFYGQPMTAGDIYTVAGGGPGGTANGIPALQATLMDPDGVALDRAGNLLLSDSLDNLVRVVAESTGTFYGQPMTAGDIYTIAGGGSGAPHLGDGGPATSATLTFPDGLTVDPAGNVVIADFGDSRMRVVAARTGTFFGQAMTAGDIYTVAGNGNADFCCDGMPATTAEMNGPAAVATDRTGDMGIADETDNRIRFVAAATGTFFGQPMTAGDIYTVAGDGKRGFSIDGIPATQARLNIPQGVGFDRAGNLLIADTQNNRIRVVAARTGTFYGQPMTAGDIYGVAGTGTRRFSGDGGPATSADLATPSAVVPDRSGNLVIADGGNDRVRVVAVTTGTFYGKKMTAGDIYTVAGDGSLAFSGDGGPATGAGVGPVGVAIDQAGNLVITDGFNMRVRVVAERTGTFYGQQMTAGDIYTVAGNGISGFAGDGGPATSAEFQEPLGVAVDGAGNIIVADTQTSLDPSQTGNNRVRVVAAATGTFYGVPMTAGDIYTVAGNGVPGLSGDGHAATGAELDEPVGVSVDSAGNVLVADVGDGRVREISR